MKDYFVVFTENNARIYKGVPEVLSDNVLVNPDRTKVRGIPPHFWKKVGNDLLPMTEEEKIVRLLHMEENGVINDHDTKPHPLTITRPEPIIHTVYVNKDIIKYVKPTFIEKASLFATGFLVATFAWLLILTHK